MPSESKRQRPESKRPTAQVKLRLLPADAAALREAAAGKERTLSDHVAWLLHRRERFVPQDAAQVDELCRVGRKLDNVLHAVQLIDSNIGKLNGRLKDLFELDYGRAMAHQDEINETLREVRALRSVIAPQLTEILDALDKPAAELTAILRRELRRRKRAAP